VYVIHRPSDTASSECRTGFDADDDRMIRARSTIASTQPETPTFAASPLPDQGHHVDADLYDWMRQVMDSLEERVFDCD
jgi:hypothetical protein